MDCLVQGEGRDDPPGAKVQLRVIILEGKGPAQNNTDARAITQPNPSIDCAAEHHFAFGFSPRPDLAVNRDSCLFNPTPEAKKLNWRRLAARLFHSNQVDAWPTAQVEGPAVAGGALGTL